MAISNKTLYKLEINSTKRLPVVIALLYIINSAASYAGYELHILSMIGGMSLLPLGKLYLSSYTYKLCTHHRIFIYYIFAHNIISNIDYFTYGSLITDRNLFLLHIVLFSIFLFTYIIIKRRYDFYRKHRSKIP